MTNQRPVQLPPETHKKIRMLAARFDLKYYEVVQRGIALLEAQIELPHPTDGTPVPVVYQQTQEGK
jgi:hypothetical protein